MPKRSEKVAKVISKAEFFNFYPPIHDWKNREKINPWLIRMKKHYLTFLLLFSFSCNSTDSPILPALSPDMRQ